MAKRFKFRLDPLLRIRRHREEVRKQALAGTLGRLNEQTTRAARYDTMIQQEHRTLREGGLVGQVNVRLLAHHRVYVNSLMRAMVETLCERASTQQQAARQQAELIEAAKQRKVLEKLRQRRWRQWSQGVERVERNQLDEMGVVGFARAREADRS